MHLDFSVTGDDSRTLTLRGSGPRGPQLLEGLA